MEHTTKVELKITTDGDIRTVAGKAIIGAVDRGEDTWYIIYGHFSTKRVAEMLYNILEMLDKEHPMAVLMALDRFVTKGTSAEDTLSKLAEALGIQDARA